MSYQQLVGTPLVPAGASPRWLYEEAPFCVLAHDSQADPCFIYANKAAQACFEYAWEEFVGLPSRLSAGPAERADRQRLLDQVASQGYASNYRGLRVSKTSRRFWIEDGTVWQLIDAAGLVHGQAAVFGTWHDAWAIT